VRQVDKTTWECIKCGERLQIARGKRPIAYLVTAPGKPRERVITVDGEVIHRCLPDIAQSLD
jgi:hypothetical protein